MSGSRPHLGIAAKPIRLPTPLLPYACPVTPAELSRTEGEIVNALSYAEATRTQLEVQEKYPQLASRLQGMGAPQMR